MNECKVCANADNEYCFACDNGNQFKPQTNADRIRAMSDEEMASYLTGVWYGFEEVPGMCDVCDNNSVQNCGECWLDWLKSAVEEMQDGT